jgi:hypothetical protein
VLAAIAAALLALAATGWMLKGPDHPMLVLLGWLSIVVLLELPAVAWRMRGASGAATLAAAILGPLVPLEILLAVGAHRNANHGGDMQGFELWMMAFGLPPIALVTASLVAVLACRLIRPADERD